MWQFTFYFPFYCPSSKPRAKMKFNGQHFDNLIIMAGRGRLMTFPSSLKSWLYLDLGKVHRYRP